MGGQVRFNHRLQGVKNQYAVSALEFVQDRVDLSDNDCVISAVPAAIAEDMFDGIVGPNAFSPIVNGHFSKQAFDAPSFSGWLGELLNGYFPATTCFGHRQRGHGVGGPAIGDNRGAVLGGHSSRLWSGRCHNAAVSHR